MGNIESEQFDLLIVGAGPAGLAAGIAVTTSFPTSSSPMSVGVLERNATPGRKLLLAGSGQCNLTHGGPISSFLEHYGGEKKARFVKPALFEFDNVWTSRFFERHGVPLLQREDGKIFPQTLRGKDVLAALTDAFSNQGGRLLTNRTVRAVEKTDYGFRIETEQGGIESKKLVLATGGASYPATGSTGDGFRFAEMFGHSLVEPRPALTSITVKDYPFTDSAGISFRDAPIEILNGDKRISSGRGDVLLTHRGLSGPGILDLSRTIRRGDTVRVALGDSHSVQNLLSGKKSIKNALIPLGISERFLIRLLEFLEIDPDRSASEVNRSERKRLENAIGGFPFVVERLGGWNEAMCTVGGVALNEVNRQTMESRIVPGLFFCGEILDVDGDTGGYNIQFALSSGFLAGKHAIPLAF